jgi:Na+/H+ antiporter NhaD/arsenite permease-like protein
MNATGISLGPIPLDFILFACILLGIALFHGKTLQIALVGLIVVVLYKLGFTGFKDGPGISGLIAHLKHEWIIIANLLGLLLGFSLLSKHFEDSGLPQKLPDVLPDGRLGAFALLVIVFVMSAFLDNIAAALIGGAMAKVVFKSKLHIGYLAAIVAASNGGGSGSVVGDTTTTMMWIDGVAPRQVFDAYIAAVTALLFFGYFAAGQQHRHNPIMKDAPTGVVIDWGRIGVCVFILLVAVAANVICNLKFPTVLDHFPVIGAAVWVAILLTALFRKPDWRLLPDAFKGSLFLLSLVVIASLMPVEKLPPASWPTTLGLGFVSAVFDNIPLTALALKQGGYDWGMLAFAVGFGGSMIWFGSSAGVALANTFPEARSVGAWLKGGWHIAVAYVLGFGVMLMLSGWHPEPRAKDLKKLSPKATPAASITAPLVAVVPLPTALK